MKRHILPLLAALRFLTIFPVSWRAESDGQYFSQGLFYFSVIGLGIGGLGTVAAAVTALFLPPSLVVFVCVVLLSAVSGFLHIDGLADSADGLLSSRGREEKLIIMRDSRTGAMGIVAIVVVFGGKVAALNTLPHDILLPAILLMPIAGRMAIVVTMAMLPYARPEGGLGRLFYSEATGHAALISTAGFLAVLYILVILSSVTWQNSICLIFIITATIILFSGWCRKSLGGATGDTLGALCEITELMAAVAMTIRLH